MTFKKTALLALGLVLMLSTTALHADCRSMQDDLPPGDWVVRQSSEYPATIHPSDRFDRGLQLIVRGQVCTSEGKAIPGATIRLVEVPKGTGAQSLTFRDIGPEKRLQRVVAEPDGTGHVRAALPAGSYALEALDENAVRIEGSLVFDLRVIQGFSTALAYGEITKSR